MFDEGHNQVTMHLPESTDRLNQQLYQQRNTHEETGEVPSPPTSLDVEYDDDYKQVEAVRDDPKHLSATITSDNSTKGETKGEVRRYSLDMWNGSPVLPNLENLKSNGPDA